MTAPFVDVRWPIRTAGRIPLQHQYVLLSAVSRLAPDVHKSNGFGIHPIRGMRTKPGFLDITPASSLTIRLPAEQLGGLLVLSGKKLELAGCPIRLGVPQVFALVPHPNLVSHLVTIKGYLEADAFAVGIRNQLDGVQVGASVDIEIGTRRVLRIKQQTIVGFQVAIRGLDPDESLVVQHQGIGGRRHMGCGLFVPSQG